MVADLKNDANEDAIKLFAAINMSGTDAITCVSILCQRTAVQREEIAKKYSDLHPDGLVKHLQGEIVLRWQDPSLQELLVSLAMPKAEYLAVRLNGAIKKGDGKCCLISLLCAQDQGEIVAVNLAYQRRIT